MNIAESFQRIQTPQSGSNFMNRQQTNDLYFRLTCNLKEGDILFIRIPRILFLKVAEATRSWANHVGIVLKRKGEWVVAESAIPFVRYTPLKKFIKRTEPGYWCLKRYKEELTTKQLSKIHQEIQNRIGTTYHLGFDFDSRRTYCSKLVYQVYLQAVGVEIGQVQSFQDLLKQHTNPQKAKRFWRWYYLGFIPWRRKMVSPASQLSDKKLETIDSGAAIEESTNSS